MELAGSPRQRPDVCNLDDRLDVLLVCHDGNIGRDGVAARWREILARRNYCNCCNFLCNLVQDESQGPDHSQKGVR